MKKAIFAGFAVLLALALVTCEVFETAEEEAATGSNIVYDENGNPWGVNLAIGGTTGRALTLNNAVLYTDYYEVAFYYQGSVYRTTWDKDDVGRLVVPFGTYDHVGVDDPLDVSATKDDVIDGIKGAAILFAGTKADKTLLAVGKLKTADQTISVTTTRVTFDLISLKNDINLNISDFTDTPVIPGNTTFEITTTSFVTLPGSPVIANPTAAPKLLPVLGTNIPFFPVEADFGDPDATPTPIPAAPKINTATWSITPASNPYKAGIRLVMPTASTYEARLVPAGFPTKIPDYSGLLITAAQIVPDLDTTPLIGNLATGAQFPTTDIFSLTFTVAPQKGLAWLSVDIPVYALDDAVSPFGVKAETWHIRGGENFTRFDAGIATESRGGRILIGTITPAAIIEVVAGAIAP